MYFRKYFAALLLGLAGLALVACGPTGEHEPSFGDAWVAPATLQVRKELTLHSPVSVVLRHGDRVELLGRRRRFVKIRASNGAEGWTDSRLLLSADAREEFDDLQQRATEAPSLGRATVMDLVTVHTAPYRQAPALFQLGPKASVEVVAHQRLERLPWDPPPLLEGVAKRSKAAKKKEPPKIPPPPAGPPPAVPDDWLLISGYLPDHSPDDKPEAPPPAPPVMDDWTLVRVPGGHAGWVLDRMLYVSIPDDVIQYAERARIVAYFEIGKIRDGSMEKPVWLWASQSSAAREMEFDSLRIFTWSARRHRWETSWIERNIRGAGPVVLMRDGSTVTGFRIHAVEKDGHVMRREYALQNYRARIVSRVAEQPPAPWFVPLHRGNPAQPDAVVLEKLSPWQKTLRWFNRFRSGTSH